MPKNTAESQPSASKNGAPQREPWTYAQRFQEPDFHAPELTLTPMNQIEAKPLVWEGRGHAPRGSVTIIAGEHGAGKSLLALYWASLLSTGYPAFLRSAGEDAQFVAAEREAAESRFSLREKPPFRGAKSDRHAHMPAAAGAQPPVVHPSNAVIAHAGDLTLDALRRRIDAAGGSPERIAALSLDWPDRELKFTFDMIRRRVLALTCAIRGEPDVRLLVIDNLEALAGNMHEPPGSALLGFLLASLAELAALADIAIVALVALPRSGGQAAARRLDALCDAAPVVYLAADDPERPGRKLLLPVKNNFAPPSPAKAFEIIEGRVQWIREPVEASADEFIAPLSRRLAVRHERESAARWLLAALADGPIASGELFRQARDCGISPKTLRRAAASLGLSPRKTSFNGPWQWQLAEPAPSNAGLASSNAEPTPSNGEPTPSNGQPEASASGSCGATATSSNQGTRAPRSPSAAEVEDGQPRANALAPSPTAPIRPAGEASPAPSKPRPATAATDQDGQPGVQDRKLREPLATCGT